MQREAILSEAREIASGEREHGLQSGIHDARAAHSREPSARYALIGGARRDPARAGAALPRAAPQRAAVPRPHGGRALGDGRCCSRASLIAILTTLGIVLSLLFESLRFFQLVPADVPVRH